MTQRESELYAAVSEEVAGWDRHEGVVAAGLGFAEDAQTAEPYFVRVYLAAEVGRTSLPPWLPRSLPIRLCRGDTIELPVRVEYAGQPKW